MQGSADGRDGFWVREADAGDLAVLSDLEEASFGAASWGDGGVQAALSQAENETLLGYVQKSGQNTPAAFVMWRVMADEAEILTLGVAPAWRGRGYAKTILSSAIMAMRRSGAASLFLEVAGDNEAAIALYAAAGFDPVGARAKYYRNGADALIMLKNIG